MSDQIKSEPNVEQVVPFLSVSNMEESLHFYVDGLGFQMTKKWTPDGQVRWCWLELGGAALMMQDRWSEGHEPWVPSGKVGEGVSIVFICKDALAIYRQAKARGIRASTPFVGNHMWVTSMSDPDGYRVEFESGTDVPEETVYSGSEG